MDYTTKIYFLALETYPALLAREPCPLWSLRVPGMMTAGPITSTFPAVGERSVAIAHPSWRLPPKNIPVLCTSLTKTGPAPMPNFGLEKCRSPVAYKEKWDIWEQTYWPQHYAFIYLSGHEALGQGTVLPLTKVLAAWYPASYTPYTWLVRSPFWESSSPGHFTSINGFGLNCTPHPKRYVDIHPENIKMWPYLDTGSFPDIVWLGWGYLRGP